MTLALIDGDILAFRAAAGVSQKFDFNDGDGQSFSSNPEAAREAVLQSVAAWSMLARCKDVMVAFTGKHNFRKTVLPSYKAGRTKGKPPDYWTVVEAVQDRYPSMTIDGLEADDVMGILATTDRFRDACIVLTLDKDLRTVPGRHLNPIKETKPVVVAPAEGVHLFLIQTLMGDPTDGYKGIHGCGPRAATKLLGTACSEPVEAMVARQWPKVAAAYRKAGLTEDDALQQARCARILWREDYDKTTREVLLWHPSVPVRLPLAAVCGTAQLQPPMAATHSPPILTA